MGIFRKIGSAATTLTLGVALMATAAPAQASVASPEAPAIEARAAIDSRCSITPLTPYKDGNKFRFGGRVNCSAAVATKVASTGQRQGTGINHWVNIASNSATSSGTTSLSKETNGSCLAGNSTYRSATTGQSKNGGQTTKYSGGAGVRC